MRELVPVLSCREAVAFEGKLLPSEEAVWNAMHSAGTAIGRAILRDCGWWKPWPSTPKILLLIGKGNNGGDALIAASELARRSRALQVTVVPVYGRSTLKALPQRAFALLEECLGEGLRLAEPDETTFAATREQPFDVTIDGILGAQFSLPVRAPADAVIRWCREHRGGLGFRVAVDLPTGMGDNCAEECFSADVTYATGVVKRPVLASDAAQWTGRLRFLDLGFFARDPSEEVREGFVSRNVLAGIGRLRRADSDKRDYGNIFVLGGSPRYPGAILMAAQSAVRGGAGLVTAMVAESLAPYLAVGAAEVMWIGLPVRPEGSFAPESVEMMHDVVGERGVLLIGPGLISDRGNVVIVSRLLRECHLPVVLDAGALEHEVIAAAGSRPTSAGPVILTPHRGEFFRISRRRPGPVSVDELKAFSAKYRVTTVLKGPVTRISDGLRVGHAAAGNPVLARGGSGDILSGLMAARLAVQPDNAFRASIEAVMWHGEAANALARARGETAVRTTELLDYLAPALRIED